ESLVAVDGAVSTWRDIEAHRVLIVNHDAGRAQIGPAFFRIMGDIDAAGPDVPSTVQLKPARRRKSQKIDVLAATNILQHGPFFNHRWRNVFESFRSLPPLRDESQRAKVLWHPQAQPER